MLHRILSAAADFNPTLFWEYRAALIPGLLYNFYVFFLTVGVAIGLGFVGGALRLSHNSVARGAAGIYAEVCRNTPEYIALIWIYYVPPILIGKALGWNVSLPPVLAAVIALGLSSSGYFVETVRAGILAVPRGHLEAAAALGMSRGLSLRRIVLPQAVRHMAPETMNQLVSLFKGTTLVSLIAVPDLMYRVSLVSMDTDRAVPLYSDAAVTFFIVVFAMTYAARALGRQRRHRLRMSDR